MSQSISLPRPAFVSPGELRTSRAWRFLLLVPDLVARESRDFNYGVTDDRLNGSGHQGRSCKSPGEEKQISEPSRECVVEDEVLRLSERRLAERS